MCVWFVLVGCRDGGGDDPPVDSAGTCAPDLQPITAMAFDGPSTPYPGEACIQGRADIACVRPDTAGRFTICAPKTEFGLRFTASGHEEMLILLGPNAPTPEPRVTVARDQFANLRWPPLGGMYPPTTTANLVITVFDSARERVANAEVAILPSAGLTVVYGEDAGNPDQSLTRTSLSGTAYVAKVPPGTLDIQVNSTALPNCAQIDAGYASPDNSQDARIPITAGVAIFVALQCKP